MPSDWRAAFAVHILTASGAAVALLALMAAVERTWPAMFAWLGLALLIDGIDGPLARRYGTATLTPRWSGDVLDLVVDFLTYVFVPAFAIARSGLLPEIAAIPAAVAIVVSGALYFADGNMKTDDNYFRGFPGLWNAVAFYVFLIAPPPWIGVIVIALLVVLTFVPFPFLHPLRVEKGRTLNVAVLGMWAVLAVIALFYGMAPGAIVTVLLCAIGVYVAVVGVVRREAELA